MTDRPRLPGPVLTGPLAAALAALLTACASPPPPAVPPRPAVAEAWRAPLPTLPHGGQLADLARWWASFDDPQLLWLIERAQAQSPSLAVAAARRREAQAQVAQVQALRLPQVQAQAQAARGQGAASGFQTSSNASLELGARWEMDLFGAQRAQGAAAQAQADASNAQWHEARVSLAADVAAAYLQLRHAQAQEEVAQIDLLLAEQAATWGQQLLTAGLANASDVALRNTERAVAAAQRSLARADTEVALQTLALWCAEPAATLAARLTAPALPAGPQVPQVPQRRLVAVPAFAPQALPASVLAQRPDVHAAHLQWLAAVQQANAVQAQRYPQLSLNGLVGQAELRLGGSLSSSIWSIAPSLSLPLWDGGLRDARQQAAQAQVDAAAAQLQQRWQLAVAEVEEALQRVRAGRERQAEVDAAQRGWEAIALRSQQQAQAGLQSGPQRNQAARNALAAYSAALAVRHEHAMAWIRLYRALGGGWTLQTTASTR